MGNPLAAWFVFLLVQVAVAEKDVQLEVVSYNSSVVNLSCTYKRNGHFSVKNGGFKCFDYDSGCSYYNEDKCKFSCKESDDPHVALFQIKLNGSCQEEIPIICGTLKHEMNLLLRAQSDPPVISINNGNIVEAGTSPVPIVVTITNRCDDTDIGISGPSGVRFSSVVSTHTEHGTRFTTTAKAEGKFFEAGNYTITIKEKGKFVKNLTIAVDEPKPKGSGMGHIGWVLLVAVIIFFGIGLYCYRRRRLVTKGKPELLQVKDSICGIWVKEDGGSGKIIQNFIEQKSGKRSGEGTALINETGKEVCRAKIENTSFVQEDKTYAGYFAVISSDSITSEEFKTYLTSVIVRIQNAKNEHESTFTLVLLEEEILSKFDQTLDKNLMDNLKAIPNVTAFPELDDTCLLQISEKVKGPRLDTKQLCGFGNTGVGLAWSYFRGYLALILPEIKDRIEKPEVQKKYCGINPHFIIIIPESGRTPPTLKKIDKRFSTIGPLDDGIRKSRAGHPERPYKNFVHKFEKSEDDCYYFCGEYANPVSTLDKMCAAGKLSEVEMKEQLQLFTQTLQSILQSHPKCGENAVVFTFKEVSTMADELCLLISKPNQPPPIASNPVMRVTRVAEGLAQTYYYGYLTTIGPTMAERILECDKQYSQKRMPTTFFILLPYSCYCHPTLESADEENIKKVGDLEPHVSDVAGNKRSYDTAIHQISAAATTYLACVEYCTPVLVMYEMAKKENVVGMSPLQLAAELRVFYEILYDLLHGPSAPEYCHNLELIYYNDEGRRPLSEILVEKIKESLGEEHKCLPKCLYACNP